VLPLIRTLRASPKPSTESQRDFETENDFTTLSALRGTLKAYLDKYRDLCEMNLLTAVYDSDDDEVLNAVEHARENLLTTRITELQINRTIVSSENYVAGFGLFALRALSKGELITCYPADGLVHEPSGRVIWGKHVPKSLRDPARCFNDGELQDYEVAVVDEYTAVGLAELGFVSAAYCGHYANDGASLGLDGSVNDAATYVLASQRTANAEHYALEGLHAVTVTTRNIAAGDEILVSYGIDYWLERAARTADDFEDFFSVE